uniref:Uncharacterized protein n=1 Tax=viral metagenome TaxID=1070528 RepID=A0A6C0JPG5_9ZZZZ
MAFKIRNDIITSLSIEGPTDIAGIPVFNPTNHYIW